MTGVRLRRFGSLTIDQGARLVTMGNRPIGLTRSEFDLLMTLVDRSGAAISNRELLQAMWGAQWWSDTTPLQVTISRLRHKLGESGGKPRYIVTVRGYGYRFDPDPGETRPSSSTEPPGLSEEHSDDPATLKVSLLYDRQLLLRIVTPSIPVLGWQPEEIVGTHFSPGGLDLPAVIAFLKQLRSGSTVALQGWFDAVARDGTVVKVFASITLDRDQHGHLDGVVAQWRLPRGSRPTELMATQKRRDEPPLEPGSGLQEHGMPLHRLKAPRLET